MRPELSQSPLCGDPAPSGGPYGRRFLSEFLFRCHSHPMLRIIARQLVADLQPFDFM